MTRHLFIVLIGLSCALNIGCTSNTNIHYRKAPGALGPYSGSVSYRDLIFVSGKIGQLDGSFAHEVQTAIDAIEAELVAAGVSLDDVLQATVFLTDLDQYGAFNEIYGSRFKEPFPARACIQVSRLPADARVEIRVIARRP